MYTEVNSSLNGNDDPILLKSILALADSMGPEIARKLSYRCFLPVVNLLITNKTKNRDSVWKSQPEFWWNIDFLCSFRYRTCFCFKRQYYYFILKYSDRDYFNCPGVGWNYLNDEMSIEMCVKHEKIPMHFNISLIEWFLFVIVEIFFLMINDKQRLLQRPVSAVKANHFSPFSHSNLTMQHLSITAISLDVDIMKSFFTNLFHVDHGSVPAVAHYKIQSIEKYKYSKREKNSSNWEFFLWW